MLFIVKCVQLLHIDNNGLIVEPISGGATTEQENATTRTQVNHGLSGMSPNNPSMCHHQGSESVTLLVQSPLQRGAITTTKQMGHSINGKDVVSIL